MILIITGVKFKEFDILKRNIQLNNIYSHSLPHRKYVVTDWLM
jgi:hypothetical protein